MPGSCRAGYPPQGTAPSPSFWRNAVNQFVTTISERRADAPVVDFGATS